MSHGVARANVRRVSRKAPKAELLRVVRLAGGEVAVDPTGSAPGRGAYVHRDVGCVEAAVRSRAFAASAPDGPDGGCSR